MTKVKRSFFEKLTGARNIEENEYEIEQRMPLHRTQHATPFYEEEETEAEMIVNQPSMSRNIPLREEETYSSNMEDNEGQLTIDVYQTDSDIVIKSTIAGVKPEDLDVSINNDMITIRGERKQEEQIPEENYYYQECYWGSFSRSVILPIDVMADKIEAAMKNGILTIKLPKADSNKTKRIQVRGF